VKIDVTLRCLTAGRTPALMQLISGRVLVCALPTVHPVTRDRRMDFLALVDDDSVQHLEWQADYEDDFSMRMLCYWVDAACTYPGRRIQQTVIQVGGTRLLPDGFDRDGVSIRYRVIDARTVDRTPLLESPEIEDNILAILFGNDDLLAPVRLILSRIARLDERPRRDAIAQVLILANFRRVAAMVMKEIETMSLQLDIEEDSWLAELVRKGRDMGREEGMEKGLEKGMEKGLEKGLEKGRMEGEALALLRLTEKRFGPVPDALQAQIMAFDTATLEACIDRVLEADSLETLFASDTVH